MRCHATRNVWGSEGRQVSAVQHGSRPGQATLQGETVVEWMAWYYSSCYTGINWTHHANRMAFCRHQIAPRTLVDTNKRSSATTPFEHKAAAPVGFAPVGINKIYHSTGEINVAHVARDLNLVYCPSSAGSCSIEDFGEASGDGVRFSQLYQSPDDEQVVNMVQWAHDSGYQACILTTDTRRLAWRHDDEYIGNYAFYHEHVAGDIGLNNKMFLERLKVAEIDPTKEPKVARAKWMDKKIWHGHSHT